MSDDISRARRRVYERVRSSGATHGEARDRAESSVRRVMTKIERGQNPEPGSTPDKNKGR